MSHPYDTNDRINADSLDIHYTYIDPETIHALFQDMQRALHVEHPLVLPEDYQELDAFCTQQKNTACLVAENQKFAIWFVPLSLTKAEHVSIWFCNSTPETFLRIHRFPGHSEWEVEISLEHYILDGLPDIAKVLTDFIGERMIAEY